MSFYNYKYEEKAPFKRSTSMYVKILEEIVIELLKMNKKSELFYIVWMKKSNKSHWFRCIYNGKIYFIRIDNMFLLNNKIANSKPENQIYFYKEGEQLFNNIINGIEEDYFTIVQKMPKDNQWKECTNSFCGTYAYKRQLNGQFIFIEFISICDEYFFSDIIINNQIIRNRDPKNETSLSTLKLHVERIMFNTLKKYNQKNDWFNSVE